MFSMETPCRSRKLLCATTRMRFSLENEVIKPSQSQFFDRSIRSIIAAIAEILLLFVVCVMLCESESEPEHTPSGNLIRSSPLQMKDTQVLPLP